SGKRRVGEEGRTRWAPYNLKKKKKADDKEVRAHRAQERERVSVCVDVTRGVYVYVSVVVIMVLFSLSFLFVFFFFQAEDGIRDSSVTGVQTCALPISSGEKSLACSARFSRYVRLRS